MAKRRLLAGAMLLTAVLPTLHAQACPDCPKGIRDQVHAGIFDGSFTRTLAMTALPFGVLAGITAAIHLGLPRRRRPRA